MTALLDWLRPYRKAITGAVTAGALALLVALLPAGDGGSAITGPELTNIIAAVFGTGTGVWGIKNLPRRREAGVRGQRGAIALVEVLLVAILVLVILLFCGVHFHR